MALGRWIVAGLVGILAFGSTALAQDNEGAERPRRERRTRQRERRRDQPRDPVAGLEQRMTRELQLTEDQQKQVKQILDTHKQAVENWNKENAEAVKAAREKLAKAMQDRNREAITAARAEMAKLNEPRQTMQKKLVEQLKGVLTDEQKPKLDRLLATRRAQAALSMADRLRRAVRRLRLDEDKAKQVEAIIKTTEVDVKKVEAPRDKAALWNKAVEKIKAIVGQEKAGQLDTALRATARDARQGRGNMFANLNLSEDQNKKVQEIMAEARKKASEAERGDRREIYRAAMEKITKDVLTEEQAKAYEKQRAERMERFRQRGNRGNRGNRGGNREGGGNAE